MHAARGGQACLAVCVLQGSVADPAGGFPEFDGVIIARSCQDDLRAHVMCGTRRSGEGFLAPPLA